MKKTSLKQNFIFNFIYQILVFIIPLITTPYVSRVLTAEGIGRYSYSYSIAYYFVMFTMLGISNYGTRNVAKLRNDFEKLSEFVCNGICLKFIIGILLLLIYLLFCINSKDLITLIFSIYVISAIFDITWLFFGLEEFKITVVRSILIKVIATSFIFVFVNSKDDIYIYTLIMTAELLSSQLFLWKYLKKYIKYIKPTIKEMKKQIIPNLTLFIPVISVSLYKMMDKTMLGFISGNIEVGYLESSSKIMAIPVGFIVALGTVMLPRVSNLFAEGNKQRIKEYFAKGILFSVVVSSLLAFGIVGVAKEFVPLYFGPGFEKCINLFYILLPTCIFQSIANVVRTQYLIPLNKDDIYLKSVSLGAVSNLIINFILIPKFDSIGAAIGTFVAEFLVCWYQCFKIKDEIKVNNTIKKSLFPFLLALVMGVFLVFIDVPGNLLLKLITKIFLGASIYVIFILLFYLPRIKVIYNERSKND